MSARMASARPFGALAEAVLVFLTVYLPLEEFLLKWLPLGETGAALSRLFGEALLYGALAAVVAAYRLRGLALPSTPIDRPFALFCGLALASLVLGGGGWLAGLVNLRVLVRYVAAFYLAVYLCLERAELRRLVLLLVVGALVQAVLGIGQHLAGGAGEFWLPRYAELELGGVEREFTALTGGIERGAALGTAAHSVAFALVLLAGGILAAALALVSPRRALSLGAVALACALGILFSYSRATLLAFGLALFVLLVLLRRRRVAVRVLALGALFGPALLGLWLLLAPASSPTGFVKEKEVSVSPLASLAQLFTPEYQARAESSRLWILRDVGGELVENAGLLGFGPDEQHAKERVLASGGAALARLAAYRAFEDVYWVAVLAYYGFLGLCAFVWVLVRLAASARALWRTAAEEWELALAAAALSLLAATLPLTFLVRTFEFRAFAFDFWLLAGLVVGALGRKRDEQDGPFDHDLAPVSARAGAGGARPAWAAPRG